MRETKTQLNDQDDPETNEDGFTLVEILVAVVIISILTTGVVLTVIGRVGEARSTRAASDIRALESAVELFRLDMGGYPETLEDLVRAPRGREDRFPRDGYVKFIEDDPWGNPYIYTYPGEFGTFDIASYGEDAQPGGEGDAADIVSWER